MSEMQTSKIDYTNGELGILLVGLQTTVNDLKKDNKEGHDEIKKAQAYTNGTVKKHEKALSFMKGAWAVISILLVGLIIPLTLNYFQTRDTVKQQVQEALGMYLEIEK